MPYQSIKSLSLSSVLTPAVAIYKPVPFGLYFLVYTPALDFLADLEGNSTDYPHRALVFDAMTLGNAMHRFLSNQGLATIDVVHIRLNDDADFIPTSIAGTPIAYQITRNVTFSAAQLGTVPQVYVDTHPGIDDYAYPVPLGAGVLEAIQDINVMVVPAPVVLYYESAANTYAAFMTITQVAIP